MKLYEDRQRPKKAPRLRSPNAINPENITAYHPAQAEWSWNNLPDVLYIFKSPHQYTKRERVAAVTANTLPTKPSPFRSEKPLRLFDVLPDRISSCVEEFRVEAWRRIDGRITLSDITARMHPAFRIRENALQFRLVRFRQAFNILAWGTENSETVKHAVRLEEMMRAVGIDPARNSTRGITPGLLHPHLGEVGGRMSIPKLYSRIHSATVVQQGTSSNDTDLPEKLAQSPCLSGTILQNQTGPEEQSLVFNGDGTAPCNIMPHPSTAPKLVREDNASGLSSDFDPMLRESDAAIVESDKMYRLPPLSTSWSCQFPPNLDQFAKFGYSGWKSDQGLTTSPSTNALLGSSPPLTDSYSTRTSDPGLDGCQNTLSISPAAVNAEFDSSANSSVVIGKFANRESLINLPGEHFFLDDVNGATTGASPITSGLSQPRENDPFAIPAQVSTIHAAEIPTDSMWLPQLPPEDAEAVEWDSFCATSMSSRRLSYSPSMDSSGSK